MNMKLKDKLMSEYWTESFHLGLEDIDQNYAKTVVESMSDGEISRKVNVRKYQEDYIADYLEYLWDLSESSFWNHVKILLNSNEGFLWSDNMFYIEKLCSTKIPKEILIVVLNLLISIDENGNCTDDIYAIGCVVKAQVENFNRILEIDRYIESLTNINKHAAKSRITKVIKTECKYTFF